MMAEAWGTPPWEIVGGKRSAWVYRWRAWKHHVALANSPQARAAAYGDEWA